MAELIVAGSSFNYPEPGEKAGWGEEATAWAEAVTDALADIVGPNDILLSNANILNARNETDTSGSGTPIDNEDPTTAPIVSGLTFDTGEVKKIEVPYFIVRTTILDPDQIPNNDDETITTFTESGTLTGSYNGISWDFAQIDVTGDSGVEFDIRTDGQVVYYSTDLIQGAANTSHTGIVVFRASTIDN